MGVSNKQKRFHLLLFCYSCEFRLQTPREKSVNIFPVTTDIMQSADILLQFFCLVTQIPNQSKLSADKDTISFCPNISKRPQTLFADPEVKSCILPLELSLSQGL